MLNAVMSVRDRPRLTEQSICTFMKNTDVEANLTVVDDASAPETRDLLRLLALRYPRMALLRNDTSKGIVGAVKNLGVYWSEKYWGRGDWLVLCDNDCFFMPTWASRLINTHHNADQNLRLLGGQNHPYHLPMNECGPYREYLAVAGTCWLMDWITWDEFGPLDANAPGVCQSEDAAFCNRIREAGGKVGAIYPPVVYDCGITQTGGTPSPGADVKQRVAGAYYE